MSDIRSKTIKGLVKRYRSSSQNMQNIDLIAFAHFLVDEVAPTLKKQSWQTYTSAVRFYFKDDPYLREANVILRQAKPEGKDKNTSGKRRKKVLNDDFEKLVTYANEQTKRGRTKVDMFVLIWLNASIVTGLRPHEWRTASLDENRILTIKNSKLRKCVQTNWPNRFIDLGSLDDSDFKTVTNVLTHLQKFEYINDYNKLLKKCNTWLRTANKKVFPRRKMTITLLSGRHQFIANLKASGRYSPVEIAYLVGHANDKRAFDSYAPASSGYTGVGLPTIPDDKRDLLQHVRLKLDDKIERRAANLEAKNNGPGVS